MDNNRRWYTKMNDETSTLWKSTLVNLYGFFKCWKSSSSRHNVTTLLILSALCFASPVVGQDMLDLKYRIEEEQPSGTYVGNVLDDANLGRIYDSAALQLLQFRFLRPQDLFVIDNITGIVRTNSQIDREAICPGADVCDRRIDVVLQPQQYFRLIRVSVTILDVNDNGPVFEHDEQVVEVSESAAVGSILLVPSAIDQDSPEFSIKTYRLESSSDRFELVGQGRRSSGASESKLMLAKSLDRELADLYRLKIIAADGGFPPNTGTMDVLVRVLDVNDNNPVFEMENYTVAVLENIKKQTTVLQMRAVDRDVGLNGEVVYSLSVPSVAAYGNVFGIDNASGDLYIKGDLDFEENSIYYLTVIARDRGADSVPVTASVTVLVGDANDNAPEITISTLSSPGTAEVLENSPLGTFVAHFSVFDKDSGENKRFECHLNDSHFRIAEMYTTEFQILTAALVDRENQSSYGLALTCTDFGLTPQESVQYLRVLITDVNDNDPVFSQSVYREDLIENNYIGKILLTVNATDRDSGRNGEIAYRLSGDSADWFHVDPDTGLITAAISVDREVAEKVEFTVVAHDKGDPRRSSTAQVRVTILDVNDEKPVFSHSAYSFAVMENLVPGAEVGTVAAHDRDSSIYGEITYAILPTEGSDSFDVDHKSGVIRTMRSLDREMVSTYYLTVMASDREVPPLSSTASVTIYVSDENDNSPVFDYPSHHNNTLYISNRTPKRHVITRLRAHDADVGQNGKLVFDVKQDTDLFDLDLELGTVLVNGDLTDMDGRQFVLEFAARDEGVPTRTSFARLNVIVNRSIALTAEQHEDNPPVASHALIVLLVVIISGIIIIALVVAIVVVCRKGRDRQTRKYNCRAETLKMISQTVKPSSISDCSDCSGAAEHGSSTEDKGRKELSLTIDEHDNEPSGQSACVMNPYTLQPSQASSSLLGCNSTTRQTQLYHGATVPSHVPGASKFQRGEYQGCQTVPLLQANKDAEANRLIKVLNDNDTDSIHSGEGSYTDSGHGPSEEGESNANSTRQQFVAPDYHANHVQGTQKYPNTTRLPAVNNRSPAIARITTSIDN